MVSAPLNLVKADGTVRRGGTYRLGPFDDVTIRPVPADDSEFDKGASLSAPREALVGGGAVGRAHRSGNQAHHSREVLPRSRSGVPQDSRSPRIGP